MQKPNPFFRFAYEKNGFGFCIVYFAYTRFGEDAEGSRMGRGVK